MKLHPVSPEPVFSGLFQWKRAMVTAVVMVFSMVTVFAQSPEVRKAFRLIDIEQPSKGLKALEQLVSSDPENSDYLYYLGLAQIRTGNPEKAMANFEKGISIESKSGLNHAGKGHVRLLEKNPTDAKVHFDQALKVSRSKDPAVLKAIAEAYLSDTKYLLDAIELLNKAKGMEGADPETHVLLGDALLIQSPQQGGPAISSYERGASADPKSGKPHFKIGQIWQKARANDNAIAAYKRALAADPEYAPAYKELGEIYYRDKKYEEAVVAYEKYMAISELAKDAKYELAFFYFMAKQYDKANSIFKEVISGKDVSPMALKYYAYSLTEQGKVDEATKIFQEYFQKAKPEDIQGSDYAYFGKLQLKRETPEGDSLANEAFVKSLDLDSAQVDIAQLHADTYRARKKYAEAAEAYEHLMSIREQPLSQDYWYKGLSYYLSDQYMEADTAFTNLSERQPTMHIGFQYAAKARRQIDSTGTQGLANPMFEKVIELTSKEPDKYKKELIEAYEYFATYYINIKPDIPKAKGYFQKILELDPTHAQAKEALDAIREAAKPSRGG